MIDTIILKKLPKLSLNEWYAGSHWTVRNRMKDNYKLIIRSQTRKKFRANATYRVDYQFFFKKNPLDASNCVAMGKMIEDCLFEDDKYNIVLKNSYSSDKAKMDYVVVTVTTL